MRPHHRGLEAAAATTGNVWNPRGGGEPMHFGIRPIRDRVQIGNPVLRATTIVTTIYRPKRVPRKRKAVALEVPAVVTRASASKRSPKLASEPQAAAAPPAKTDRKPAIVTSRRPRRSVFGNAPDLTPEEHRQRGEAADALWRELVRRAAVG